MKSWELIADNLSKAGWSWGCVSAIDSEGRTIWIADAHRDDGKRFVVHADEKLTAFMEPESAICAYGELPRQAGEIVSKLCAYENDNCFFAYHSAFPCILWPFARSASGSP